MIQLCIYIWSKNVLEKIYNRYTLLYEWQVSKFLAATWSAKVLSTWHLSASMWRPVLQYLTVFSPFQLHRECPRPGWKGSQVEVTHLNKCRRSNGIISPRVGVKIRYSLKPPHHLDKSHKEWWMMKRCIVKMKRIYSKKRNCKLWHLVPIQYRRKQGQPNTTPDIFTIVH